MLTALGEQSFGAAHHRARGVKKLQPHPCLAYTWCFSGQHFSFLLWKLASAEYACLHIIDSDVLMMLYIYMFDNCM